MEKKRARILYLILGLMLLVELGWLFYNSAVVPELNSRADKLKAYAIAERDNATILPGDLYDRNGTVIVETNYTTAEGEQGQTAKRVTIYRDPLAYSQLVGYTGSRGLNPLADTVEEVVGSRNDYRLMAFLDEEGYWGYNPLYTTTGIDGTKGQSAILTIDSGLQEAVYDILQSEVDSSAEIGSAVVMDAATGEILAMVSFPSYDWSDMGTALKEMLEDEKLEPWYPVTYKNPEAPGSIFKILLAVALIDHQMEDFTVENTSFQVNQWTCQARGYSSGTLQVALGDRIGLETALNISSNVYFAQAALALGTDALGETAKKFMLTEDSTYLACDFGYVLYHWDLDVSADLLAQTGFGQGYTELTTVYAAMIVQAIANGGEMMKPWLVRNLVDADGKTVYTGGPQLLSQATSQSTAEKVAEAMRSTAIEACQAHGLASVAEIFDRYSVAGKTGTAENGDDTVNAWYVSFAPLENPQYVVAVNQCRTNKSGWHMMSVAAEIYQYLFEGTDRSLWE